MGLVTETKRLIGETDEMIKSFRPNGCSSTEVGSMISRLAAFNQISSMIHSFGAKPTSLFLELRRSKRDVMAFIQEQGKRRLSTISDADLRKLLAEVFQDDYIISPNCVDEFHGCPYYRFHTVIGEYRKRAVEDLVDEDVLRYLRVIATNVDSMLNEIDQLQRLPVPEGFKEIMKEKNFLSRLDAKLSFFDLSDLHDYLARVRSHEVYADQLARLGRYEHELNVYRQSGADQQLQEIDKLKLENDHHRQAIADGEQRLKTLHEKIATAESQIGLVTTFNDGKRYRSIIETTLETTNKVLIPLETAGAEKRELRYQLEAEEAQANALRNDARSLERRLDDYHRLVKESQSLNTTFDKLNVIMTSVSTKKGIPLVYMNTYSSRIQSLANNLLAVIYDDELIIDKFNLTADEFEIPFIRDGTRIPDIRYASQSELSLITMALSFALAHGVSQQYGILLLDEIDAGLDEKNRQSFLRMFDRQMRELNSEQAFIISHNLSQMVNLPMDVIKLSETNVKSKLQNIIYDGG
jgi:DNA repair exonuclease SbcCD ATPase subunit